ncbi:unnamed protein product [Brugia pahangi]|uniref:DUF4911 domain-containing protein n=1 Tax=Brugia pahangi TaxID=6280 RepID=A0A0N4TBM8_BRUPA|nr:unnamed protein product [Brugia pahangi]
MVIVYRFFRYDDKYILEAEYMQEPRTGYIKVLKSIGAFIDEEGVIVLPLLEKELAHIINSVNCFYRNCDPVVKVVSTPCIYYPLQRENHGNGANGVMPNNVQRVINGGHQNVASTSG